MEISYISATISLPTFQKSAISAIKSPFLHTSGRLYLTRVRPINSAQKRGLICNSLFGLGVPELAVIAGVAALVFGPKQIPEIGRSIGKTVKGFQQAAKEFEAELKKPEEPEPSDDGIEAKSVSGGSEEKENITVPPSKES